MSFQQGLSGLNATAKSLEVIGNNIANASTYGAKASRAEFGDVYAAALNGAGTNTIGIGVNLTAVSQQFTQGNILTTENPMDLAITRATGSSRSTATATSSTTRGSGCSATRPAAPASSSRAPRRRCSCRRRASIRR